MSRLRDDDGFTLVEVLLVALLGVVVVSAAFTVLDTGRDQVSDVQRRTESTQRARLAADTATSVLRSTLCSPAGLPPVERATATSVDVWADLSGGAVRAAAGDSSTRTKDKETRPKPPDRVRLALEGGTLVTYTWTGSWATPDSASRSYSPALTAAGTKRLITTGLEAPSGTSFLRYYGYASGTVADGPTTEIVPGVDGVSSVDLGRIVRFAVAVRAMAAPGNGSFTGVEIRDDVTSPTVDPADSTPTLECST